MSHHQDLERCAGKCAGLVFLKPPSNKKEIKAKDRRGQPVRGLWLRYSAYYARITVEDPNDIKRDWRFFLDASTYNLSPLPANTLTRWGWASFLRLADAGLFQIGPFGKGEGPRIA